MCCKQRAPAVGCSSAGCSRARAAPPHDCPSDQLVLPASTLPPPLHVRPIVHDQQSAPFLVLYSWRQVGLGVPGEGGVAPSSPHRSSSPWAAAWQGSTAKALFELCGWHKRWQLPPPSPPASKWFTTYRLEQRVAWPGARQGPGRGAQHAGCRVGRGGAAITAPVALQARDGACSVSDQPCQPHHQAPANITGSTPGYLVVLLPDVAAAG